MEKLEKLLELTNDSRVELASEFKEMINTHLVLGQSRWVCRYGTLSDGHEKLTSAQRYYQAIKEMWYLSQNIRSQKALALFAHADLLDAEEELFSSTKQSEKLRSEAKILQAKDKITNALVTVEDQMRMVDEYNKIRLELKEEVETKYPGGIEQAESDNWEATYKYRMIKAQTPGLGQQLTSNIPLPVERKAELGAIWGRPDSIAPFAVLDEDKAADMVDMVTKQKQLEGKNVESIRTSIRQ